MVSPEVSSSGPAEGVGCVSITWSSVDSEESESLNSWVDKIYVYEKNKIIIIVGTPIALLAANQVTVLFAFVFPECVSCG